MTDRVKWIIWVALFLAVLAANVVSVWMNHSERQSHLARIADLEGEVGYWSGLAESAHEDALIYEKWSDRYHAWADEWQRMAEATTGGDGLNKDWVDGPGLVGDLSIYAEWTDRWRAAMVDRYFSGEPVPAWVADPHHYPEVVFPACEREHWLKILELRQAGRFDEYLKWPVTRFCGKGNAERPAVNPPAVQPCVEPVPGRTYTVTEDTWATMRDPKSRVAEGVLIAGGTMRVLRTDPIDEFGLIVAVDYTRPSDAEDAGIVAPSGRALLSVNRFCDATVGSAEAQRQVKLLEAP